MLEIADRLLAALDAGERVAVATVTDVIGSAPRTVGTSMALAGGRVIGSISGGCVEGAAVDACERVLETGASETDRFGFTDDDAFAVGLSCGGEIDVIVTSVDSDSVRAELEAARAGRPAGLAIVVGGPGPLLGATIAGRDGRGSAGDLDERSFRRALGPTDPGLSLDRLRRIVESDVAAGFTGRRVVDCGEFSIEMLVESRVEAPLLLIVGAVEFAAALAVAARPLGYRIVVCDARPAFATPERFPAADEVVVEWPHLYLSGLDLDERSVICVLSHDDRFDVPVLREALDSRAGFVGALGSRRTHERRRAALVDAGVSPEALDRLRSPIGLDLGASSPEETAIAILAEIIAVRSGGSGSPLRELDGPIHREAAARSARQEAPAP
ncbi:MAG: XdhC family protein [Naasia sp.]